MSSMSARLITDVVAIPLEHRQREGAVRRHGHLGAAGHQRLRESRRPMRIGIDNQYLHSVRSVPFRGASDSISRTKASSMTGLVM